MKKLKSVLPIAIALVMLFSSVAFATAVDQNKTRSTVSIPTLTAIGGSASCGARVQASGANINATLELYQGSTLVAWWTKTGTGLVSFSETAPYVSGLSYTLTISGSIDGVDFPLQSVTKTLW